VLYNSFGFVPVELKPEETASMSAKKPGHNTSGLYTEMVCELFDAVCLANLAPDANYTKETPSCHTVFFIGFREDLAAGERGGELTGYFSSKEELESFCKRNWEKFTQLEISQEANLYDTVIIWK
jgi:hypothetical protein